MTQTPVHQEPLSPEPVPMTVADCDQVLAFWREMPGIGLSDADSPDGLSGFLRRNPGLSLVLRRDERIVGAVLCGHDGRRGYLHHLAVVPELRRRGLAGLLVERCLQGLRSQGIGKCNVFVYADNDDGVGFWRRTGWSGRDDLRVMQRVIPNRDTAGE